MKVKIAMIVILLLEVREVRMSVISSPNSNLDSTGVHARRSYSTHNVTIDCGDWDAMSKVAWQCLRDLSDFAQHGYPWSLTGSQRRFRHNRNTRDGNNTLRDPLDSINHVCHAYDISKTCLEESGIRDYCLATYMTGLLHIDFQFICQQKRDENLVRSLQCLYDNRLLVMLYFHIADHCDGFGALDDIMRQLKTANVLCMGYQT